MKQKIQALLSASIFRAFDITLKTGAVLTVNRRELA